MSSFWRGFSWRLGSNLANQMTRRSRRQQQNADVGGCLAAVGILFFASVFGCCGLGILFGPNGSPRPGRTPAPNQPAPAANPVAANPRDQMRLEAPRAAVPQRTIRGMVVSIADGDTLKVLDAEQSQHTIRLQGIDSPEGGQPSHVQAHQALAEKVFRKQVRVEVMDTEGNDRLVGDVYVGDRHINLEMVAEGWAWHDRWSATSPTLASAEQQAREAQLGLWAEAAPVPPWDWRQGVRIAGTNHSAGSPSTNDTGAKAAEYARGILRKVAQEIAPEATVYVTDTGSHYHSAACRHVRKSSRAISLSAARGRYSPCSVCGGGGGSRPPQVRMNSTPESFDTSLQESTFRARIGSKQATIIVFPGRDGKWHTRRLDVDGRNLYSDVETPAIGPEWDRRIAEREEVAQETEANQLLVKGKAWLDAEQVDLARSFFTEVTGKFPETEAAVEAQRLLDELPTPVPLEGQAGSEPTVADFESERRALQSLDLAIKLMDKKPEAGKRWLRRIVEEYPGTKAARRAQELLD